MGCVRRVGGVVTWRRRWASFGASLAAGDVASLASLAAGDVASSGIVVGVFIGIVIGVVVGVIGGQ